MKELSVVMVDDQEQWLDLTIFVGEFAHKIINYVGTSPTWIRRIEEIIIHSQLTDNVLTYLNTIKDNIYDICSFTDKFKDVIRRIEVFNEKEWIHFKTEILDEFAHMITNCVGSSQVNIRRIEEIIINAQIRNSVLEYLNRIQKRFDDLYIYFEKFKDAIKPFEILNEKERIHLKTLIDNIIENNSDHVENCKIDFKFKIINEDIEVFTYKDYLSQTLTDIIKNSVDAIHVEGNIEINCSLLSYQHKDSVLIKISDTGSGIPNNVLIRIFEPFYSTKGNDGGIGLGLYLSKLRVYRMGGEISVASVANQRTTFTINLPCE